MRLRLEFMKRFMIFPTSILSIRLRRYPRKIQKPTQKTNSYVSDVRYISSSVKIYKGMSFYLRILSFYLGDLSFYSEFFWTSIGIYYTECIVSSRYFSRRPGAGQLWTLCGRTVSVGICGRDLLDKVLPRQKLFSFLVFLG